MTASSTLASPSVVARRGIWGRQLDRYPAAGPRAFYLGVVVASTITLYYELFIQGSVATQLTSSLHMSLAYLIAVGVVGYAVGALGSLAAGLADRWGRANLVVYGTAVSGVLVLFGLANAHTKLTYLVLFAIVNMSEGVILVATSALVRDFSPQLGRASAMGFWALAPVTGSLLATEVSSHTLDSHPDWQYQFRVCGVVGLAVFAIAFVGLRELAPQLRDQRMVSVRDRVLVESRARGVDPEQELAGRWRHVLKFDVIGSSFSLGVFLLFYYMAVGLFVVFFSTTFGYSSARANALGNWYWAFQAVAMILGGVLSDRLKVRKPFMLVGGLISAVGVALFAIATTHPDTTYYHFVWIIVLIAIGGAMAVAAWMAAFTETVENRSPAATAASLGVWAATLRILVVAALWTFIFAVPAAGTLVDEGQRVQAVAAGQDPGLSAKQNAIVKAVAADPSIAVKVQTLAAQDKAQLATAALLRPATQAALAANPTDRATQAEALSEITGKPAADVVRVLTISAQDKAQLATAAAIDPATQAALVTHPDAATQATAVGEIASRLHVPVATAMADLQALAQVPPADLVLVSTEGPIVQKAAGELAALGAVPPADLQLVAAYGPALQQPAVAADLAYLQKEGPIVRKAASDGPSQWQRWWWICFAGQLLFLPFIGLLAGRWSPAKARADAKAHDEAVARELAALADETSAGRSAV